MGPPAASELAASVAHVGSSELERSSAPPCAPSRAAHAGRAPSACHPERSTPLACEVEGSRERSQLDALAQPPPPFMNIAAAADLDAAFCSSASSGRPPGQSLLASVAHRDSRPTGAAIAEPPLRSGSAGVMLSNPARGRRCSGLRPSALRTRAFVGPSTVARAVLAPGFCCGPRSGAIWRPRAAAISRRLTALATKPSARPARRPLLSLGDTLFWVVGRKPSNVLTFQRSNVLTSTSPPPLGPSAGWKAGWAWRRCVIGCVGGNS
jgi:hypothetical protein